jgi:hypothetical protein
VVALLSVFATLIPPEKKVREAAIFAAGPLF